MTAGRDPVAVVRASLDEWEVPFVELDVFGTADAGAIVEQVDEFARRHLGSGVAGYLFCGASVGSTHGVVLADGREVVIKARPPAQTNPDLPLDAGSLAVVVELQRFLADRGYACPRPILGPREIGRGLATVEVHLAGGRAPDRDDAEDRRRIAVELYRHIELLKVAPGGLRPRHFINVSPGALFPQPHSKLFAPSEADTGWIRGLARRARDIGERTTSREVIGHCDWRVEHLRFAGGRLVASYDWDSLATRPEIVVVGVNAHGHTADWSQEEVRRVPTHAEMVGFIADYEEARGEPFTAAERRGARAWAAYWIAYGAWISVRPGERDWPDDSWPALLRDCGEALLR
jgi:hypothetical protein